MALLLVLVLQLPALRPIAKHAGAAAPALALAVIVGGAVLYATLPAWIGRPAVRWWQVAVAGLVVAALAVSLLVYPQADALRAVGRGSDQDDGLIQAATALVRGADPYGAPSYLGLPLSAGPGLVIAAVPFVAAGFYPGLTLAALALALGLLGRWHGWAAAGAAAVLLGSSLSFWELVAIGSDLVAVGAIFLAIALAIGRVRRPGAWIALALVAGAAATARLVFLYLPVVWPLARWRGDARAVLLHVALALAAAVALHAGFALVADRPYPPLHLLGKGAGLLAGERAAAGAL
ncbi:MAG: hypothetical protein AB7O45_17530, partial [Alphaproteobacteria bacterium]